MYHRLSRRFFYDWENMYQPRPVNLQLSELRDKVLDFLISIDPMKDILLRPHCEAKTVEVFLKMLKGTNAGQF